MILLLNDYARFPSAVPDTTTTNGSFLRYSALLRDMGIRNYMWPLMIHDKRLCGINPHDPNLSDETKSLIRVECRYNPIYALREVIRLPTGVDGGIPFLANRGNMAMVWAFFNDIDTFFMMIRQTGKTYTIYVILVICSQILQRGGKSILVTKDHRLRKANISAIKEIRNLLPGYINPYQPGVDSDNQEEITVKRYSNFIYSAVGRKDPVGANAIGRGLTCAITGFDEAPFTDNIQISMPAAIASGNAARPLALASRMPASVFVCTTAGEINRREGEHCHNLQLSAARFSEKYFDIESRDRLKRIVRNQSSGDVCMLNIEYDHAQLGYSNEWLYDNIRKAGGDEDSINRDFFNIWSNGTNKSPLTKAQKDVIMNSMRDPDHIEITKNDFILNWYVPEVAIKNEMMKPHVIGADTSDAVGRDDITFNFTNILTGCDTATAHFNEASLIHAADWLADLMIEYPNTILVIESRSSARTFLDACILKLLAAGFDPFKRIYSVVVQQYDSTHAKTFQEIENRKFGLSKYMMYKRYFGFATDAALRSTLYGTVLFKSLQYGDCFRDRKLGKQTMELKTRNGRIDHGTGNHDDSVIAKLLAMYFIFEGRNHKYYGLNPMDIMKDAKRAGVREMTRREKVVDIREQRILDQIKSIEQAVDASRSEFERSALFNRLRVLRRNYKGEEDLSLTFDALYEKLNKKPREESTQCRVSVR